MGTVEFASLRGEFRVLAVGGFYATQRSRLWAVIAPDMKPHYGILCNLNED